jgi:hypothetical protein
MKSTYIIPHGRFPNPHTRNPHTKATNPHTSITWVVDAYKAPSTVGQIHIGDYEKTLRMANMMLYEVIFKLRRGDSVPVE